MPFCEKCGREYREGASFCKACGTRFDEDTTEPNPVAQTGYPSTQSGYPGVTQTGAPYAGGPQPAGRSTGGGRSWLPWVISVAISVLLVGAGLGLYFGLRGDGDPKTEPIVSDSTTTTTTVGTTTTTLTTTSETLATTTTLATAAAGTAQDPLPLGQEAQIGAWKVKVVGATLDATQVVLANDPTNEPPSSGSQYVLVRIEATNTGAEPADIYYAAAWRLVGSGGTEYWTSDAVAPEDLDVVHSKTLPGETVSGNAVFMVDSDELSGSLLQIYRQADEQEFAWFAIE